MIRVTGKVGAAARNEWHAAQEVIRSAQEKLREIGLRCKAIDRLEDLNFNRPDRDKPSHVTRNEFEVVSKIDRD